MFLLHRRPFLALFRRAEAEAEAALAPRRAAIAAVIALARGHLSVHDPQSRRHDPRSGCPFWWSRWPPLCAFGKTYELALGRQSPWDRLAERARLELG